MSTLHNTRSSLLLLHTMSLLHGNCSQYIVRTRHMTRVRTARVAFTFLEECNRKNIQIHVMTIVHKRARCLGFVSTQHFY